MKTLLASLLVILIFVTYYAQNETPSGSGRIAPNFTLENLERELIEVNDYIGKGPLLLCFWSSCCKSAVAQIEAFSSLYDRYKDVGFIMLAIATDDEKTIAKVKPFIKSKKFKFPVLYDTDGNVSRMYYAFDIPFCVLINKSGEIIYSHLGYMKGDKIEVNKIIRQLLLD
ncbi:peroxiredoxin family protein [Bacteroidota bacterium]